MSMSVAQIFVKISDVNEVATLLHSYVEEQGNQYISTSKTQLIGLQQVLTNLVKKRRKFQILCNDEWICIWEIIHDVEIADPAVSKYLSKSLLTQSIWTKIDCNYNIWAYQIFENGKMIEECFEPISYFVNGDSESEHSEDYGFCLDHAEMFNKKQNLPYFLETMSSIKRKPSLAIKLISVTCEITS